MIYVVMTYRRYNEWGPQEYRIVGYFETLQEACKAVETNACDIYESGYYHYAMIEDVKPGIYGSTDSHPIFYEWIDGAYRKVGKPKEFDHLTSFTIG